MKNLATSVSAERALAYAANTAATVTGLTIDTQGCYELTFFVFCHAVAAGDSSNKYTIAVYESDDSGMSGETAITDTTRLVGSLYDVLTTDANAVKKLGVIISPNKRYIRIKFIETGTADATLSGIVLKHPLRHAPPS
jgi:hypothetical protein